VYLVVLLEDTCSSCVAEQMEEKHCYYRVCPTRVIRKQIANCHRGGQRSIPGQSM
jgi:hypothetical protein